MDIKDRIKLIMEQKNLNASSFAESINMSQASVSHNIGERNKFPSTDFILHLSERFPEISLNWLMNGQGPMYITGNESREESQNAENPVSAPSDPENRLNSPSGIHSNAPQSTDIQKIVYIDKPQRKITEIRIFFNDNTYEIFKPEK